MRTASLVAFAVLLGGVACGSFPHPSEDYECQRDRDCPDGRICRSNWCVTGGRACDAISCDDFEDCTVDSCMGGECRHEPMEDGTPCGGAGSCVSAAVCDGGACLGEPEPPGQPCDDGFYCTERDACDGSGGCVGEERPCESAGACTVAACDEEIDACVQEEAEDYTTCDDGDACTENDVCQAGACDGGDACECDESCDTCTTGCCRENLVGCPEDGCQTDCLAPGCACYFGCAGSRCGGECQEDCTMVCGAAASCDIRCSGDSQCQMNCLGAADCKMDCTDGAHCLLECGGINGCDQGNCDSGWTDCGGDVYVCNRPCP